MWSYPPPASLCWLSLSIKSQCACQYLRARGAHDLLCRDYLCCVAWFSYWCDNLGFISEGNIYRRCAASSLPLWGNIDVASSDITHVIDGAPKTIEVCVGDVGFLLWLLLLVLLLFFVGGEIFFIKLLGFRIKS